MKWNDTMLTKLAETEQTICYQIQLLEPQHRLHKVTNGTKAKRTILHHPWL